MELSGQLHDPAASSPLLPGKRAAGIRSGSWVGPRAGLDMVAKTKDIFARI